jgi:hypothetical protein
VRKETHTQRRQIYEERLCVRDYVYVFLKGKKEKGKQTNSSFFSVKSLSVGVFVSGPRGLGESEDVKKHGRWGRVRGGWTELGQVTLAHILHEADSVFFFFFLLLILPTRL